MNVAIDVIASIDKQGDMVPLYLEYKGLDFKIEKIIDIKEEKYAGIRRISYECYNFNMKEFKIVYDIKASTWYYVESETKQGPGY